MAEITVLESASDSLPVSPYVSTYSRAGGGQGQDTSPHVAQQPGMYGVPPGYPYPYPYQMNQTQPGQPNMMPNMYTYAAPPGGYPYGPPGAQGGPPGAQGMPGMMPGYPGAMQYLPQDSWTNTAYDAVKRGLHKVKICKYDATEMQRQLEGELFDKWHESCEVTKATKIPFSNISAYLDHLQDAYEGIDAETRKKMNGVLFVQGEWEHKLIEWKFNKGDNSGARYGMIAFGRSADQQFVDCMFVMYKMDFKISPKVIVTKSKHSALWGLVSWTTTKTHTEERALGEKSIKTLQNFFRNKALEGFYKEGVIESINYVQSLDEIPDAQ